MPFKYNVVKLDAQLLMIEVGQWPLGLPVMQFYFKQKGFLFYDEVYLYFTTKQTITVGIRRY